MAAGAVAVGVAITVGVLAFVVIRRRRNAAAAAADKSDRVYKSRLGDTPLKASEAFAFSNTLRHAMPSTAGRRPAATGADAVDDVIIDDDNSSESSPVPAHTTTSGDKRSSTRFTLSPMRGATSGGHTKFVPHLGGLRRQAGVNLNSESPVDGAVTPPGAVSSSPVAFGGDADGAVAAAATSPLAGSFRSMNVNPLAFPATSAAGSGRNTPSPQHALPISPRRFGGGVSPVGVALALAKSESRMVDSESPSASSEPVSPMGRGVAAARDGASTSPAASSVVHSMVMGRVYNSKAVAAARGGKAGSGVDGAADRSNVAL